MAYKKYTFIKNESYNHSGIINIFAFGKLLVIYASAEVVQQSWKTYSFGTIQDWTYGNRQVIAVPSVGANFGNVVFSIDTTGAATITARSFISNLDTTTFFDGLLVESI